MENLPPKVLRVLGKIQACNEDYKLVFDVLSIASMCLSFLVFANKLRKIRQVDAHFPNNFSLLSCGAALGFSTSVAVSALVQRRQLDENASQFLTSLCFVQAFCFQFFISFIIWHWILVNFIMYQMLVNNVSIATLRTRHRMYYVVIMGIVLLTVVLPMIYDHYGPLPLVSICWINGSPSWRFALLYSHMVFGTVLYLKWSPLVLKNLYQASQTTIDRERNSIEHRTVLLRATMIQHSVYAIYFVFVFISAIAYGTNNFLLEVWDGAFDSQYIIKSSYSICVVNLLTITTNGIFIPLIYTLTYASYHDAKNYVLDLFSMKPEPLDSPCYSMHGKASFDSNEIDLLEEPGRPFSLECDTQHQTQYEISTSPHASMHYDDKKTIGRIRRCLRGIRRGLLLEPAAPPPVASSNVFMTSSTLAPDTTAYDVTHFEHKSQL